LITIANANAAILIAMVVMLLVAIPVDPRKNAKSKWIFWLIGPMVCTASVATGFYGSMKSPETSDVIGAIIGGAMLTYIAFGGIYLRKRWPVGRWPGSRS
jgi:hypothetical protein